MNTSFGGAIASLFEIVFVYLFIGGCILAFYSFTLSLIFDKCGKKKWEAWVPFYRYYVLTKICGLHWMYAALVVARPIVSFLKIERLEGIASLATVYGLYMLWYNLSKKFNQSVGFSVGLLFLPLIFIPILAFSKDYTYDSSVAVSEHGVFGTVRSNNVEPVSAPLMERPAESAGDNISELIGSKPAENVAFCPSCGTKVNPEFDRFCPNCGKEIKK